MVSYKESWQKQKSTPGYKEYHRAIAREWFRKNRSRLKGEANEARI
jgi:hypothetical protein